MFKNGSWVLYQDNAPAHHAVCQDVFDDAHRVGTSTLLICRSPM